MIWMKLEKELVSVDAECEREENVWIVYDSFSSLAAIFNKEPLLLFLTHDTSVDMTIGRNTLLLVKKGALDRNIASRLENLCEHILNVEVEDKKIYFEVSRSTGVSVTKNFWIRSGGEK